MTEQNAHDEAFSPIPFPRVLLQTLLTQSLEYLYAEQNLCNGDMVTASWYDMVTASWYDMVTVSWFDMTGELSAPCTLHILKQTSNTLCGLGYMVC